VPQQYSPSPTASPRGGGHGWATPTTLLLLAAVALGAVFVWLQTRRTHPMLPLGLLRDRNRTGAYVTVMFVGLGLMGTYYLLSLYMQQVLGYGPIRSGLATLPVAVGIVISAGVSTKLVERFPVRAVAVPGLVIAALGLAWFSTLNVDSTNATHILPALFLTYFGLGMGFIPMTLARFTAYRRNSPAPPRPCSTPHSSWVPRSASQSCPPSAQRPPAADSPTTVRHYEPF